jgi:hypothetical protein
MPKEGPGQVDLDVIKINEIERVVGKPGLQMTNDRVISLFCFLDA